MCSHFPFLKTTVEKIADGGRNIPMWNLFGIGGNIKGGARGVIHRISTADVYQFKRNVQALTCRGMYSIFTISLYWKVVSELWFGHPKSYFQTVFVQYKYSLKMALRVPKSKFWDHFSIQISPQNPQKATSGTKIGPQKRKSGPQKCKNGQNF